HLSWDERPASIYRFALAPLLPCNSTKDPGHYHAPRSSRRPLRGGLGVGQLNVLMDQGADGVQGVEQECGRNCVLRSGRMAAPPGGRPSLAVQDGQGGVV